MTTGARITSEKVAKAAIEMRQHFFVPFEIGLKLKPIVELSERVSPSFKQPINAFCSAIDATHATSSLPYLLASSKASALHFQRFHTAERIRNLPNPYGPAETRRTEEEANESAYKIANDRFRSFQESDDGLNALVEEISATLLGALKDASTSNASNELLYQGLVSLWSAFEVLVRDVLTTALNISPELSERLLSDPSAKKYFDLPKVSIEELSWSGYNLSNRMGDLLLGSRDFSDIRAIKAATMSIFGGSVLAEALNDNLLWLLNQDRHLIVHRRGVIDGKYIQATGTQGKIGESITVSPAKLEDSFGVVIKCAGTILSNLAADQSLTSHSTEPAQKAAQSGEFNRQPSIERKA